MALAVSAQGCAATLARKLDATGPYCGLRTDIMVIGEAPPLAPLAIIDAPLSAAVDTILLPKDLYELATSESTRGCRIRMGF